MNSIPRYDPTAGRCCLYHGLWSVIHSIVDFPREERTRGIAQPYRAWRDRSGVQMELGLRLQRTVDASTR